MANKGHQGTNYGSAENISNHNLLMFALFSGYAMIRAIRLFYLKYFAQVMLRIQKAHYRNNKNEMPFCMCWLVISFPQKTSPPCFYFRFLESST